MPNPPGNALQQLWVPGPHLGWAFRDRGVYRQPFTEPEPPAPAPAAPASKPSAGRIWIVAVLGIVLTVILGVCGLLASGPGGSTFGTMITRTAVLLFAGVAATVVIMAVRQGAAGGQPGRDLKAYAAAKHDWEMRRAYHDHAETVRLQQVPEWGTVRLSPDSNRLNVIGGGLYGWEAFFTVAGVSYLATHGPSIVVDLTGEAVCRELIGLCAANGVTVDLQLLPADLDNSDLLDGLSAQQLVDVIVEAVHGDSTDTKTAKALDTRILHALAEALTPQLSMARLVAGLRVLMGQPDTTDVLAATEKQALRELFSAEYLRDNAAAVQRLEAHLFPLRHLTAGARPAATVTALALATDGTSVRSDLLADLIVAWLARRIAAPGNTVRTMMIAGADDLAPRQVARLSDICGRARVRLVLMWRHLRQPALQALGGGPALFMKLGSHEEATQAADYIGRQHTFVVAGLTYSTGGSQTHTDSSSETHSRSAGGSTAKSAVGRLTDLVRHTTGWSESEASNWNASRSWGRTNSIAKGTSWTEATNTQRVYEHRVEPTILQSLPDYGMLLVEHTQTGVRLTAVDCNPDLVSLPSVSMNPLPEFHATAPPPLIPRQATAPLTQQPVAYQRAESWTQPQEHQW